MSLTVCAYVLLLTGLVASAAAAIEWSAQGRIPVRHLWSAAILIAFLAPPAALGWHAASRKAVAAHNEATPNRVTSVLIRAGRTPMWNATTAASHSTEIGVLPAHKRWWSVLASETSARLTPAVFPVWICASAAFIIWLLIGTLHWRRARRGWRSAIIDGVQVEISPATGPAVLGVISHRIVMPAWAMSMPIEQRKLMLAHECEHVSARDPERLALAVVALVLMPWNAVLWWCAARLRHAIELDCDARVLRRYPGAKEYGNLLLDVASRGQGFGSTRTPSMALLHLPSELELRVRAMVRPRCAARRAIVTGAGIAVVAVAGAFTTPVPELPVLRNNVSTRDSIIAPQPSVMLHQVTVRVGRSRVTFDSAMYSPKMHTISGGPSTMSHLYLASDGTDTTITGSRDTLITLRRKADSLRSLSAQLAARTHELYAVRRRLDSTETAFRQAREFNATNHKLLVPLYSGGLSAEFERTDPYVSAALLHYYPNLHAGDHDARIWFLADADGRVLRTMRDDAAPLSISPEIAHARLPDVDPHDILFMSIRPRTLGDATINVIWVEVKK